MPMFRRKVGSEFEAMEFDGSRESAEAIFAWAAEEEDAKSAYWSTNQTITMPSAPLNQRTFHAGDLITKSQGGLFRVADGAASTDYEEVA